MIDPTIVIIIPAIVGILIFVGAWITDKYGDKYYRFTHLPIPINEVRDLSVYYETIMFSSFSSLVCLVGAIWFYTIGTVPAYIVGIAYTVLCIFLFTIMFVCIKIHRDLEDCVCPLDVGFVGKCGGCDYIGILIPVDSRVCDDCVRGEEI